MSSKLSAVKGMNDLLPEQAELWELVEAKVSEVFRQYGYRPIRTPIVETTPVFVRAIGEVTDIVEKEMYSFNDALNGEALTLRPENTAAVVRAAIEHNLLYDGPRRLWYFGPMFRHERPQKGRYRQFHQFGVEAFGMAGPDIDAEVIQIGALLWQELGLTPFITLQINNIGSAADRQGYAKALTAFLEQHVDQLDTDARNRMHSNPMRVLDSKNPEMQALLASAPLLTDFVSDESKAHYAALQALLAAAGIAFEENPRLVRGLDYYNNCVFEWVTQELGAQGTVCGGGRYDGLVEQLGGKPTLAAGFAMGIERLVLMLESLSLIPASALQVVDIYVLVVGEGVVAEGLALARSLRTAFPDLGIIGHCGGGKYNSQLKRAYASGARLAVILEQDADTSATPNTVKLRRLDDSGQSETTDIDSVVAKVGEFLSISA